MEKTRVYVLYSPSPGSMPQNLLGIFTNIDSLDDYLKAGHDRPLGDLKRRQLADGFGVGVGRPGMATLYVHIDVLDPEFPVELYF